MKTYRINEYSALGTATMARNASYNEKKCFIKKLKDLNIIQTPEDKELALLEMFERCAPSIINTLYFAPDFLSEMPQEVVNYILLLTFWLKLDTQESLL